MSIKQPTQESTQRITKELLLFLEKFMDSITKEPDENFSNMKQVVRPVYLNTKSDNDAEYGFCRAGVYRSFRSFLYTNRKYDDMPLSSVFRSNICCCDRYKPGALKCSKRKKLMGKKNVAL